MAVEIEKRVSKLGRKGDARMHRAVAARLANPDLSLFEALREGGFDFPSDEDANAMDTEQVTLGQRKNQLSRRLRLARQQQNDSIAGGGGDVTPKSSASGGGCNGNVRRESLDSRGASSFESSQQLHHRNVRPINNHSSSGISSSSSSSLKRTSVSAALLTADSEKEEEEEDEEKSRKMAKFHPEFHQMPIRSHRINSPAIATAAASVVAAAAAAAPTIQASSSSQVTLPPSFHPALFARANFLTSPPTSLAITRLHHQHAPSSAHHALLQNQYQPPPQQPHQHPSGVAMASLTATAQSVGFTLEQLAVALSSSSNLVRVLANPSNSRRNKQEMALNLFRSEVVALYTRCMLMAGYPAEDALEGSSEHLQMALTAWEAESKRLGLLVERANEFNTTAPLFTNGDVMPSPRQQQELCSTTEETDTRTRDRSSTSCNAACSSEAKSGPRTISHEKWNSIVAPVEDHQEEEEGVEESCGEEEDDDEGVDEAEEEDVRHRRRQGHHHHYQQKQHASGGHKHRCFDGRHVHRLEGKCGHKAIIHLPKDGNAHIDFVVDDKVECYHGIAPIGITQKALSLWPSQYKCEDLDCPTPCGAQLCDHTQNWGISGGGGDSFNQFAPSAPANPRLLDLSDLDFDGDEWNEKSNALDESLLGLFQLGAESITSSPTSKISSK